MTTDRFARSFLCIALGLFALFGSAAINAAETNSPFVIGEKIKIESTVLGETRSYIVHVPTSYKSGKDAYPVLVLQDAEAHFALTTAAVDLLSESGRIPPTIVVGIVATNRTRDLTPSKPAMGFGGAPWTEPAGGADKFLSFVADELLPEVEHNYRTRPYRVLVGHSLGGLFTIFALMNRPQVFNGYVAISPSLWWDDQALVNASRAYFAAHKDLRGDLYLAIGSEGLEMLGGAWKMAAVLEESRLANLRWQFKRSPDEDHGTIAYLSTYEGLQAIFNGYRIADPIALFEQGGLAAFDRHYAEVSRRLGYTVEAPMEMYAGMVWDLSGRGRFEDAQAVGQKMVDRDPKNANTLLMLAEVAGMQKDDARAIGYLTQLLRSYPGNARARAALTSYKIDVNTILQSPQMSSAELKTYVGDYHSKGGSLGVAYEKGKLTATSPGGTCELRALTKLKFYCVDSDAQLSFSKERTGRITGATAEYPDRIDEYRKVK